MGYEGGLLKRLPPSFRYPDVPLLRASDFSYIYESVIRHCCLKTRFIYNKNQDCLVELIRWSCSRKLLQLLNRKILTESRCRDGSYLEERTKLRGRFFTCKYEDGTRTAEKIRLWQYLWIRHTAAWKIFMIMIYCWNHDRHLISRPNRFWRECGYTWINYFLKIINDLFLVSWKHRKSRWIWNIGIFLLEPLRLTVFLAILNFSVKINGYRQICLSFFRSFSHLFSTFFPSEKFYLKVSTKMLSANNRLSSNSWFWNVQEI